MDKKATQKLEEEYVRYIEANNLCEKIDNSFIFAGKVPYSDYLDYSND